MKRVVPVAAAVSAALLAIGAFGAARARAAREAAEPARRTLAEIAPDLARARAERLRLAMAREEAFARPPRGDAADGFGAARPDTSRTAARPVSGADLLLRTSTLEWKSVPADALSRGIAAAESDGHKLAAAEIDPARPVGNVRARLVFESLVPSKENTP